MNEIEKDEDTEQTQCNKYEQSGSAGIGHLSGGELKGKATVAGVYNQIRAETVNLIQQPSDSPKKEVGHKTSKRLAFAIAGSLDEVDEPKLQAIVALLQKITGDAFIELVDVGEGSIRLILEGSQEGLEQLETLFNSGKLGEVLGIPVEYVRFLDTSDTEASDNNLQSSFPLVGRLAPEFTATAVTDQEFKTIRLSDYRGKYVVLFFYPLDFTFVCPTEIIAFSDRYEEFNKLNTEVLGVSVDSEFSHLAWIQSDRKEGGLGDIAYPLVSDLKKEISAAYNVLDPDAGVALRGLFIIDKEGVIQYAAINNLSFGRSVDETLRILKALQYVQSHPDEVCPAGWQEGDKTMIPDPVKSKVGFGISL